MGAIETKRASALTIDEARRLCNWTAWQSEFIWDGLDLQAVLDVYHACVGWASLSEWSVNRPAECSRACSMIRRRLERRKKGNRP